MNTRFDFAGKQVLVTGGTSGIGAAVARAFRAAGADVLACSASADEIALAQADPGLAGVQFAQVDVTDKPALSALIQPLTRLDTLVHCAGIIRRAAEHEPDVFDTVMAVNLSAGMRLSTLARPLLKTSQGSIVFIGSIMSFFGGPVQPAYSASKGAIRNLTMSLAAAYAVDGIRVNAVAPGWVTTNLSRGARENPERFAQINGRIPMARWADPAEIADPILFLCSDAARYITGTMLAVDGGYMSVG